MNGYTKNKPFKPRYNFSEIQHLAFIQALASTAVTWAVWKPSLKKKPKDFLLPAYYGCESQFDLNLWYLIPSTLP